MRRSRSHKSAGADRPRKEKAVAPAEHMSVGMPDLDSITGVDVIVNGKKALHIIHTNEVDAYERPSTVDKRRKV